MNLSDPIQEEDFILCQDVPRTFDPSLQESKYDLFFLPDFLQTTIEERFNVTTEFPIDQETELDQMQLLNSAHLTGDEISQLVTGAHPQKEETLPAWKLRFFPKQVQLTFCHTEEYKSFSSKSHSSERRSAFRSRKAVKISLFSDENLGITPEDQAMIDQLPIRNETKELIKERYFRGPNHPDLRKFKGSDKNASCLFYEYFSMVFREKPLFEAETVNSGEHLAYFLINRERIVSGKGRSKKDAKAIACVNALAVLAPSLAERCKESTKLFETQGNLFEEANEPLKEAAKNLEKETNVQKEYKKTTKEALERMEIEDSFKEKETFDFEMTSLIENEEMEPAIEHFKALKESNPSFFDLMLDSFESKENFAEENLHHLDLHANYVPKEPETEKTPEKRSEEPRKKGRESRKTKTETGHKKTREHEKVSASYNPLSGLKLHAPDSYTKNCFNMDLEEHIKRIGRDLAVENIIKEIETLFKKDLNVRIDPNGSGNDHIKRVMTGYCANNVFTKLHMLHLLIHFKENDGLKMTSLYFGKECLVTLYVDELDQVFVYKSTSFLTSFEMTKYFLIFSLYEKCWTVLEIIQEIQNKYIINKKKKSLEQQNAKKQTPQRQTVPAQKNDPETSKKQKNNGFEPANKKADNILVEGESEKKGRTNVKDQIFADLDSLDI